MLSLFFKLALSQSFITETFYNSTGGSCDEPISSDTVLSTRSCLDAEEWEVPIGRKWGDCIQSGSFIPYDHRMFCAPNTPTITPAPTATPAPTSVCGVKPGQRCCVFGPVPNGVVNNNGDCQYLIPDGTQYLELTVSDHRGLHANGLESGCSSHNASNSPTTTWQIPLGACFVHNGWTPSLVSTQAVTRPFETRAFKAHCIESTGELEIVEYKDEHCRTYWGSSTIQNDECVNGDEVGQYWAKTAEHKWRTCNDSFLIARMYGREIEGELHHFDSLSTGCMKFCGYHENCNYFTFGTDPTTGGKVCEIYSECRHPSIKRLPLGWATIAVDKVGNPGEPLPQKVNGTLYYRRARYSYRGCSAVMTTPAENTSSTAMFLIAAASSFVMLLLVFCAWRLLRRKPGGKEGEEGESEDEKKKEKAKPGHLRIPSGSVIRLDGSTPTVPMMLMSPDGHMRVVSQPILPSSQLVYGANGQAHVRNMSMPSPVGGLRTPASGHASPAAPQPRGTHLRVLSAPLGAGGNSSPQPGAHQYARSMDVRQPRLPIIGENGSTSTEVQGEPENPSVVNPWMQLQGGAGLATITPEAFSNLPPLTQEYLKHWAASSLQAHQQNPIPKIQVVHPQRGSWIDGTPPGSHAAHPSYSSSLSSPMPQWARTWSNTTRTTPSMHPTVVSQSEGGVWPSTLEEKSPLPPERVAVGGVGVAQHLQPQRRGPPPAYESPGAQGELKSQYLPLPSGSATAPSNGRQHGRHDEYKQPSPKTPVPSEGGKRGKSTDVGGKTRRSKSAALVNSSPAPNNKVNIAPAPANKRRTKSSASAPAWEEWRPENVRRPNEAKKSSKTRRATGPRGQKNAGRAEKKTVVKTL